jgi:hypothetical protein
MNKTTLRSGCRTIPMIKTHEEQLRLWVEGKSVHVKVNRKPPDDWECCPDFSCCHPELQQPKEVRKAFVNTTQEKKNELLMFFLGEFIEKCVPDQRVHIAGQGKDES